MGTAREGDGVQTGLWSSNRQATGAKPQVNRDVELGIVKLSQNIRANNTQLRAAKPHKGCDIEGLYRDQVDFGRAGAEPQASVVLVVKCSLGGGANGFENGLTITGQSPFWQGQYKGITHGF
jgi:hypothetical protein